MPAPKRSSAQKQTIKDGGGDLRIRKQLGKKAQKKRQEAIDEHLRRH